MPGTGERKGHVLVVEDDQNIAKLIQLYLTSQGYAVKIDADGASVEERLQNEQVDLVILDLLLPHRSGWEICRKIREQGGTPVIILTAKGDLRDKLLGFELGADDYIVKPFDPLELLARVKAVLRRSGKRAAGGAKGNEADGAAGGVSGGAAAGVLSGTVSGAADGAAVNLPGLRVDLSAYEVFVAGEKIELTRRETELLYFLAGHPNRVFTREYLLKELWGYDYPGGTRTVDVHINRLRDKIEKPGQPWQIKTVWGVGYKFETV
ncbi:MAG: response regulator transcription factor [Armatimonadetes bacterium]|nr:response regulator transcription factor [Armatimonadota bacterium]